MTVVSYELVLGCALRVVRDSGSGSQGLGLQGLGFKGLRPRVCVCVSFQVVGRSKGLVWV